MNVSSDVRERNMDKIRKLLAKAGNNPSRPEAETCILKAQELMANHNISEADLADRPPLQPVISGIPKKSVAWWMILLSQVIADNFRCYAFALSGDRKGVGFMGFEEDVGIAREIYEFAERSVLYHAGRHYREAVKRGLKTATKRKNDYTQGYIIGLKEKLESQAESNGWGLVLSKDPVVENKWIALQPSSDPLPQRKQSKTPSASTIEGYHKGRSFEKPAGLLDQDGEPKVVG